MDTVYYEGRERRYTDYPITDIMQMIGQASYITNKNKIINNINIPNDIEVYTSLNIGLNINLFKDLIKKVLDNKWKKSNIPKYWDGKTSILPQRHFLLAPW